MSSHEGTQIMAPTTQLLRSAEALTMPGVQVIVLNANMGCQECRDKVSKVLSKIDYLLDYVVDVTQKKVTVRGRVDPQKRMQRIRLMGNDQKRKNIHQFEGAGSEEYSTGDYTEQHKYCNNRWKLPKSRGDSHMIKGACCFRCASS